MFHEMRIGTYDFSEILCQPEYSTKWPKRYFSSSNMDMDLPKGFIEDYYPVSASSTLLKEARSSLVGLSDPGLINRATSFLIELQKILDIFEMFRGDLRDLPPLRAYTVDDGSILFEWDFSEYRFGFSIEPNPEESSWYLVTKKSLGSINASGLIYGVNLKNLLAWLTGFIMVRVEL